MIRALSDVGVGTILLGLAAIGLSTAGIALGTTCRRLRRNRIHDRQRVFYSRRSFHVMTAVALHPGQEEHSALQGYLDWVRSIGGEPIYAGMTAVHPQRSKQLERKEWDAYLLVQLPSRSLWETETTRRGYAKQQEAVADLWSYGFHRPRVANLLVPLRLLALHLLRRLCGRTRILPFTPADSAPECAVYRAEAMTRLARPLERPAVVFNYMRVGDRDAMRRLGRYARSLEYMMAEGRHGPVHVGIGLPLEGEASYDCIALVYYPSLAYFIDMIGSTYFRSIMGNKRLADTQCAVTVPVLQDLS